MQNKQQVLISIAIFVATMFGGGVVNAQNPLHLINREIARTRCSIDSVRSAHAVMMTRKLERNANYQYIMEHSDEMKTLDSRNAELINCAVTLIRKRYPSEIILRTPFIFYEYRKVPGVLSLGDIYHNNERMAQEYNRRVSAFQPEYQMIKNRCDSIRNAKIEMYQLRLDSLLNRKIELTR